MRNKRKEPSANHSENAMSDKYGGWLAEAAGTYVFVMLIVFPLYVRGGYDGLFEGKWNLFLLSAGLLLLAGLVCLICYLYRNGRKHIKLRWSVPDCMAAVYLLLVLLSYAGAFNREEALIGVGTWNMGLVAQVLFVGVYFSISRSYERSPVIEYLSGGVYVIVCGILLLQRFGFDPFGLYQGYGMDVRLDFVTTMGQVTWGSVYITVILAVCIGWFAKEAQGKRLFALGGLIALGFSALLMQNCDSGMIAVSCVMAVFFYKACKAQKEMERFLVTLLLAFGAAVIMGVGARMAGEQMVPIDEFYRNLIQSKALFICLAAAALLLWLLKQGKLTMRSGKTTAVLRTICLTLFLLMVCGTVLLFILHGNGYFPNSPVANYFHFSPWWGNSRGFIWQTGGAVFADFDWWRKLFGCGPDNFTAYAYGLMGDSINAFWQNQLLPNVHNEWLGGFLNYGLLGGMAYFLFFLTAAVRLLKKSAGNPLLLGAFFAVIAYMSHNLLCYQQVIGTSLIFLIIGMGESLVRRQEQS